jgi:hypothetical protein
VAIALLGGFASVAVAEPVEPVAKLVQIEGKVMVNTGTNYAMASPGTVVQPGAKVLTNKGSSVALVYKDGCIKRVKENSILTVGPATECAANKTNERIYVAEAVGDTATDAPPATAGAVAGEAHTGWIIGGLVVFGGAIAIASNNNDNNNASGQ